MDELEKTLRAYENDSSAESTIRNAITKAYGNLKPELTTINTYENAQFPGFYNDLSTGYGAGTAASDLSPTSRLGNAWGEVGRLSTNANVARGILDVRQAGMEDLIKSGLNQWQLGYSGAQNAWDRAYKLRALSGSGSSTPAPVWPGGTTPNYPSQEEMIKKAYELFIADKIKGGATQVQALPETPTWATKSGYTSATAPMTNPMNITQAPRPNVLNLFSNPFNLNR